MIKFLKFQGQSIKNTIFTLRRTYFLDKSDRKREFKKKKNNPSPPTVTPAEIENK